MTRNRLGKGPPLSRAGIPCFFLRPFREANVRIRFLENHSQCIFNNSFRAANVRIRICCSRPFREANVRIRILEKHSPCIFNRAFRAANVRSRILQNRFLQILYSAKSVSENLIFDLPQNSLGFTCNFNCKNDQKSPRQGSPPFASWLSSSISRSQRADSLSGE